MSVIRKLQEELYQIQTAQFVTTMLRDISATRLQAIRAEFETNKAYYQQLHSLMEGVRRYANAKHIDVGKLGASRGRIYVAMTANKRFYGSLNNDVMNKLYSLLQSEPSISGYVIGQTGSQYLELHPAHRARISTVVFANDEPTPQETHRLIVDLEEYTEVLVIHPTFISSFRQEVKITDITHQPEEADAVLVPSLEYLCEPDLPELLQFFRTQIMLILFKRVILETRLAFVGARLMKMQRARERSVELVRDQQRTIHKELTTIQSMRLLETSVGFHKESSL
jgi:F0F1-type ATP synthase gamma subunit